MRHLKLLAAVTIVLVALSGFSPARSSGGRGGGVSKSHSSGGHGGGGCSSKKSSSHSSSHSNYDSDDSYTSSSGSTSGGSSRSQARGSGTIAECAAAKGKKLQVKEVPGATVRVRNSGGRTGTFTVTVTYRDVNGEIVDTGSAIATVRAGRTRTIEVPMERPEYVRKVKQCEVTSVQ
ncbi:hypothetical protein ITI46_14990 [Streptomyces oryzae]|uniref:Secreted protein n=1 Tax=Streptomyces oryzae TaxID=1434886 RepID=A0ABS3XC54_9ACTN|nr:hypothetical protein [Streptomyces oryzae]MBO8192964.1 hypothetical protein [Streptomyces oryzae]